MKKLTLLTIFLLAGSYSSYSQNNIFQVGGRVGIGNQNPSATLDIQGGDVQIGHRADVSRGLSVTTGPTASAVVLIGNPLMNTEFVTNFTGSTDAYGIPTNSVGIGNAFDFPMVFTTNAIERFRIGANGNIGVGTTDLQAKFNVNQATSLGTTPGNTSLLSSVGGYCGSGNTMRNNLWLVRSGAGDNWLSARLHDGISVDVSYLTPHADTKTWWERDPVNNIQSWGNGTAAYLTIAGGNVGIGTTTPGDRLSVNGTIHSSEVKVDMEVFPDYVFAPNYQLASLAEVERFINQNHRLPDMPSAAVVEKEGLKLGEINKLLTQKVEELTLYLIAKDKELAAEKKRNDDQQEQIKRLNSVVEKIIAQEK